MSVLDDPRVTRFGEDGWQVQTPEGPVRVLFTEPLGWGLFLGEHLHYLPGTSWVPAWYASAEAAITAALA